jgi:hypothetical protein
MISSHQNKIWIWYVDLRVNILLGKFLRPSAHSSSRGAPLPLLTLEHITAPGLSPTSPAHRRRSPTFSSPRIANLLVPVRPQVLLVCSGDARRGGRLCHKYNGRQISQRDMHQSVSNIGRTCINYNSDIMIDCVFNWIMGAHRNRNWILETISL